MQTSIPFEYPIILYGRSGYGKQTLAKTLATHLELKFNKILPSDLEKNNSYVTSVLYYYDDNGKTSKISHVINTVTCNLIIGTIHDNYRNIYYYHDIVPLNEFERKKLISVFKEKYSLNFYFDDYILHLLENLTPREILTIMECNNEKIETPSQLNNHYNRIKLMRQKYEAYVYGFKID